MPPQFDAISVNHHGLRKLNTNDPITMTKSMIGTIMARLSRAPAPAFGSICLRSTSRSSCPGLCVPPFESRSRNGIEGSCDQGRDHRLSLFYFFPHVFLSGPALDVPDNPFGIDDECGRQCFDGVDYRRIGGGIASPDVSSRAAMIAQAKVPHRRPLRLRPWPGPRQGDGYCGARCESRAAWSTFSSAARRLPGRKAISTGCRWPPIGQ